MADIVLTSHRAAAEKVTLTKMLATAGAAVAVVREWWRRYRTRQELALYSYRQRNDLPFAAEVDAEIAKPFWKR